MSISEPFIGVTVPRVPAPQPVPPTSPPRPVAPIAKINGTQTFASYQVPNDGRVHRISIIVLRNVSVLEVGGATAYAFTLGGQVFASVADLSGNGPVGITKSAVELAADPGTIVNYNQANALTGGASTIQVWFYDLGGVQ